MRMEISELEYVRQGLRASKGRRGIVAEESGVPYGTLKKLLKETKNPRTDTVRKLYVYFKTSEK